MERLLLEQVRARAGGICEYCRMASWLYDQPFHVDHIIARKHDGRTELTNLAYCCLDCNAHKGTNVAGFDPQTGALTRLFNPRSDLWIAHFAWRGSILEGVTAVGRVTVQVLCVNDPLRVRAREVLISEGVFPPAD